MQCWPQFAGGRVQLCQRGSRRLALEAQAQARHKTNIAQNHKRKSVWINIDYDRLYTQPSYNPGRQVGPVKLQLIPGRGRGLVADREVPLADTLLVCKPVGGAAVGPPGSDLLPPALVQRLRGMQEAGQLGPADRARLRLLDDGSGPDSLTWQAVKSASLDDFRKLEDKLRRAAEAPKKPKGRGFGAPAAAAAAAATAAAAAAAAEGAKGVDTAALGEAPLTDEELLQLASRNSWGNAMSDPGAAPLRGEASQSIVGVWPEFALLNHSCVPNTVVFNVGQLLLVQAARVIPAGAELTTSYLDKMVAAPLERRQAWLRGSYGFSCDCERCKAEASVPAAVSAAVAAAYQAAHDPEALALVEGGSPGGATRAGLRGVEGRLSWAVSALEDAMEEAGLGDQVSTWLRASAYDAFFALALIRDLPATGSDMERLLALRGGGGGGAGAAGAPFSDPEVVRPLVDIMAEIAPGSDPHLALSLEHLTRSVELHGGSDPRVVEATKACLHAHILRYGRVSDAVLRGLVGCRMDLRTYLGRVLPSEAREGTAASAAPPGAASASAAASAGGPQAGGPLPLLGGFGAASGGGAAPSAAQLQQAAADLARELSALP